MELIFYLTFTILLSLSLSDTDEEYDYDYDDTVPANKTKAGARLIGARAGRTREAPFVVAIARHAFKPYNKCVGCMECTGVLITPRIVLSAAHCTMYIKKVNGRPENDKCLRETRRGGTYTNNWISMKCKTLQTIEGGKRIKNIEIFPLEPRGAVFLGVEDMNNAESLRRGQFSEIRSAIRHGHSYRGGGSYGDFGGYDITLITLATPLSGQRACLPRLQFQDEGHDRGKLAGYGMYTRKKNKCLTNQYGKMKYHYCKDGPGGSCQSGPPPESTKCSPFMEDLKKGDANELMITKFKKKGKKLKAQKTYCFKRVNPEKAEYGWCKTVGNYYNLHKPKNDFSSWGYCSKDCFLDENADEFGVMRVVDRANVLSSKLCTEYLDWSLAKNVLIRPLVLCVGKVSQWKIRHWVDTRDNGKYYPITKKSLTVQLEKFQYGLRGHSHREMISSAGTCSGDSGGPLFQEIYDARGPAYVVTGLVSGGRGKLGYCGGLNNPVHYVRVKKLSGWVTIILDKMRQKTAEDIDGAKEKSKLCWRE